MKTAPTMCAHRKTTTAITPVMAQRSYTAWSDVVRVPAMVTGSFME